MNVLKTVLRIIGWLVTIIFQIAASFLIIFLFSVIFAGVDTTSRSGWLALLFFIWLGYVVGIDLVGWVALRWVWKVRPLPISRLVATMIGALIPLLILLPIGFSLPVDVQGSQFYDLVTNHWQPILAQASLFTGILAYYIPGVIKLKPDLAGESMAEQAPQQ